MGIGLVFFEILRCKQYRKKTNTVTATAMTQTRTAQTWHISNGPNARRVAVESLPTNTDIDPSHTCIVS